MINTIFWFVDTEQEYRDAIENGDVSSKTIVFVGETREIYLNGKGYGKTSTAGLLPSSEFDAWKEQIQNTIQRLDNAISTSSELDRELINNLESELEEAAQNLRTQIEAVNTNTNSISERLTRFQDTVGNEISQSINDAITDSNGKTIWSKITETDESIDAVVNRLNTSIDENGNIKYTSALQSTIDTGINNNTAFTNISNKYAVLDENQDVIEWVTSGFKSQTDPNKTFASVYSSAQQANSNAISGLSTRIGNIEGDYLTSETDITSLVTAALNNEDTVNSLSYVATKSDVTGAESRLGARIDGIVGHEGGLAEISAKVDKNSAVVSQLATIDDSGVITWNESTFDDAVSSTLVQHGGEDTASMSLVKQMANDTVANYNITNKVLSVVSGMNLASQSDVDGLQQANANIIAAIKDPDSDNLLSSSSIQQIANDNAAKLNALVSWSGNTPTGDVKHTAGLITEAGLDDAIAALSANSESKFAKYMAGFYAETDDDGAIAQMIALGIENNAGGIKTAIIEAAADVNMSKITLSADLILLDADRTLANTIEATQGTIGGITISDNNIHSSNNKFSVTSEGKLTATDATITGDITATSLTLGSNVSVPAENVKIDNSTSLNTKLGSLLPKETFDTFKVEELDTAIDGKLADFKTAELSDVITDDALTERLSSYTTNTSLSGTLNNYPTKTELSNELSVYTKSSDLTQTLQGYLTPNNVTPYITQQLNGYVKTNVGIGLAEGDSNAYFLVDANGLLKARNAIITGQINATSGAIGGIIIGNNGIASTNGNFAVTSGGKLTATDAEITGEINASSGTVGGFTIGEHDILTSGLLIQAASDSGDSGIHATKMTMVGDVFRTHSSSITPNGFDTFTLGIGTTNSLNYDGSGSLGKGGISWDTTGTFNVTNAFVSSILNALDSSYHTQLHSDDTHTLNSYIEVYDDNDGSSNHTARLYSNRLYITDDDLHNTSELNTEKLTLNNYNNEGAYKSELTKSGLTVSSTIENSETEISSTGITSDGSVTASSFVKTGGTSSQFLKADGSVDSNTYAVESTIKSYIDSRIMQAVNLILNELHSGYSLGKRGDDFEIERVAPGEPEFG